MNKNSGLSCLLKLLMVQLIIFSISNLIIVIIDTYESLFRGDNLNPEKFINLKVLLIPILISIIIICIYIHLYKIKKAYLLIKKIDVKVLLLLVIPFLLSVIIIFLGNVYREVLVYINYDLIRINKYTIILLLVFIIITITLIYTLIKIIRNKGLLISKIGLRLIFIVGIVFIASMVLLNIMRKFIESYLLGYGNMDPKKFARIYNTVSLGFIIVVIVTCILVILSIVNKWVQYLNYMILKLRRISEIQYVDDLDINGDDEFSELASSINVMSNKLKDNYEREKKIEKEKNDFIVAVSHDLRTPLTSIIGYLDLLKNEKIQSYEKTSEYIDITYRKAIDLKNLIEELFEYTKIENDYVSLEKVEFNIAILVNQILGEQMLFFKEKNINIEFESESNEIYCEIDIKKMVRIIENIINNVQKYSSPNTSFKVYIKEKEANVLISFENIGEHIKKDDLELIFEKMYRIDKSRSSQREGSGLGLAIARKLVEIHNGRLWAECEGNTIKFNILLPKTKGK